MRCEKPYTLYLFLYKMNIVHLAQSKRIHNIQAFSALQKKIPLS